MGRARNAPTQRRIPVAQPAVGVDWTQRNDSGGTWEVRGVTFRLVTDATVANRFASVIATGGEDVWFRTVVQLAQAASLDRLLAAWPGSPSTPVDTGVTLIAWPHDGLWLPPGHVLSSAVLALAAGDQVSAVLLSVVEYPEVLPEHFYPATTTATENDQE